MIDVNNSRCAPGSRSRRPDIFHSLLLADSLRTLKLLIALLTLVCSPSLLADKPSGAPAFKLGVAEDGVYRVLFEDLDTPGWHPDTDSLAMTNSGESVPIWIEDGGDGIFGPGDHIEFVGRHLEGTRSYWNEHSRHNVYWLKVSSAPALRFRDSPAATSETISATARTLRHLERDKLRVRFNHAKTVDSPEVWYWERLSHLEPEGFNLDVDLGPPSDIAEPVSLRIGLRGWSELASELRGGLAEHRVEVWLNGEEIGAGEWNGQQEKILEYSVPGSLLQPGPDRLEIRVPQRAPSRGRRH